MSHSSSVGFIPELELSTPGWGSSFTNTLRFFILALAFARRRLILDFLTWNTSAPILPEHKNAMVICKTYNMISLYQSSDFGSTYMYGGISTLCN